MSSIGGLIGWQPNRRPPAPGPGFTKLRKCAVAVSFASEVYTASVRMGTSYVDDDVLVRLCGLSPNLQVTRFSAGKRRWCVACCFSLSVKSWSVHLLNWCVTFENSRRPWISCNYLSFLNYVELLACRSWTYGALG